MSEYNMDNIPRSLEEDLLIDTATTPTAPYIPGVDSSLDVDAKNSRIKQVDDKVSALISLLYMKESTILDVRKSDAIAGSIFFNKETNSIEYFDGQTWKSNIFGPNSILDTRSYSIEELGPNVDNNGYSFASVSSLKLNTELDGQKIIFIVADGSIVDRSYFSVSTINPKVINFQTPITIYNNLTYYILGSLNKDTTSIPKYETVEYVSDGVRSTYPISYNTNFIVTYQSSVLVYVDGRLISDKLFKLNAQKNNIIFDKAPPSGQSIMIKTLYGVTTDFRSSLTYVEQIVEATIDKQQTFQYNGVSDALNVYWNGLRLTSGKDFKYNYVQKLVVFNDQLKEKVKVGDTVTIEKVFVPMSKEPMQGVIVLEKKKADANKIVVLDNKCNGITMIQAISDDGNTKVVLTGNDYFIADNNVNIIRNDLSDYTFHISYLTNARLVEQDIPVIDDLDTQSQIKVWSANKLHRSFNEKANTAGDINQDFSANVLKTNSNASIRGNLAVSGDAVISKSLKVVGNSFLLGQDEANYKIKSDDTTTFINQDLNVSKNVVIQGNLQVYGTQAGITLNELTVADNSVKLNSNLTATSEPVPQSGITVNRGRNGESKLFFDEASLKWSINKSEDGADAKTALSLDGHKHTINDFIDAGVPVYSAITSSPNTSNEFYDNGEYIDLLNGKVTADVPRKDLSRLIVKPSSIVTGELKDNIQTNSILVLENYSAKHPVTGQSVKSQDLFAVIEDGSIISASEGSLKLPAGPTNKRWDRDNQFCGIPNQPFTTNVRGLPQTINDLSGIIRYNTELKCVEIKIDGLWVKFERPDCRADKNETNYSRGRFITSFNKDDFTSIVAADIADKTFGLSVGEKVLKINHNLNSLYVRVDIFDDKRASFPLLYKCIDENNVYVTFPSNIADIANSNRIEDWLNKLAESLHTSPNVEGSGHENKVDTRKDLGNKKFVAFVTAL